MGEIRRVLEQREREQLSPYAVFSARSRGRVRDEPPCPIRTVFQRDRDRIIHCKAFRRLKHKTQVFIAPESDHYRTRLTHTLEVAQIARTIARALGLNEDLTEAIALGHDLGHTPFGHGGEQALDRLLPTGFRHYEQSLRVVDVLEGTGGLNLTYEVRDGIYNHTGERRPATLEGQIVKLSDRIAYVNHDVDDALRAEVLRPEAIPVKIGEVLGPTNSERIDTLVGDVITASRNRDQISMSRRVGGAMEQLRGFLFDNVYAAESPAKQEGAKAQLLIQRLCEYYCERPELLPERYREAAVDPGPGLPGIEISALAPDTRAAVDYVASMTDRFAIMAYKRAFIPRAWSVLDGTEP